MAALEGHKRQPGEIELYGNESPGEVALVSLDPSYFVHISGLFLNLFSLLLFV